MGILSLFSSSPEKRIQSLRKKVQEKYGPPENRQKAMEQLLDMNSPEAVGALLSRFTVNTEPSITDAEEKNYLFKSLVALGEPAIAPIRAFLMRSDDATSWMLRMLNELLSSDEVVALCVEALGKVGPEYTRDPEKKQVLISALAKKTGAAIPAAIVPFLEDPSDDVRIEAAYALAKHRDEATREPLLKAFVDSTDRYRVIAAISAALVETGFGVQGYREKIEQGLPEGYAVNREGKVIAREA